MQAVQFLLLGMATGSLFALVALGVVLVYRASGVVNFSAGSTGAFAAFVFYWVRDQQGVNWILALSVGLAVGAALGSVTQLLAVSLLRRASTLVKLIASLGFMTATVGVMNVIWGTRASLPAGFIPTDLVVLPGNVKIGLDRLILIGLAIGLTLLLRIAYSQTLFGLATSAVAENRIVAALAGWSTTMVEQVNFVVGGLLSALAGILLAPIVGLGASILALMIVPALAAALIGRFEFFGLTLVGALGIGAVQAEVSRYQPNIAGWFGMNVTTLAGLSDAVPVVVIVIVVVVGGHAQLGRGEVVKSLPKPGSGRLSPPALAISAVAGVVLMFVLSNTWASALVVTFAFGILLLSVVVVTGYGGQLSLCQFALAGFGAWVASRAYAVLNLPFEISLLLAICATIPLGLLIALPAFRTRGVSLAVATLGFALMLQSLIFDNDALTGGFGGTHVVNPKFLSVALQPTTDPARYGLLVLCLFVFAGLVVANVRRGRIGGRLLAIRSNERAAASLGVGVFGAKLFAFGLGAALAGLSGALIAFSQETVQFQTFTVFGSITAVQFAVVGGVAYSSGALIGSVMASGGVLALVLSSAIHVSDSWLLVIAGGLVIATLTRAPDGIAEYVSRVYRSRMRTSRPQRRMCEGGPETHRERCRGDLEVQDVTVRFGGVTALDRVDITIRAGEIVGLIGPNGAGKTTLLDVITGFCRATSGQVRFDHEPINRWRPERRARAGITRSWQTVELFDDLTVEENLLIACDRQARSAYIRDLVHSQRRSPSTATKHLLQEFGLDEVLGKLPSSLPQGTSRLVGIARAMSNEPSVLLLDEPAAGLDPAEGRDLLMAIRRVAKDRGISLVIVEHDVPLLLTICERVVVLDFGIKIADGTRDQIQCDPAVLQAYLGERHEDNASGVVAQL